MVVSIHDLKGDLDHYVARARRGERIDLVENGRIVATLGPALPAREDAARRLAEAISTGEIGLVADADDLLEPIDERWEALGA